MTSETGPGELRLVDQAITVRVLTRVITTLVVIATAGWWFLFDEVRTINREMDVQRTELLREIARTGAFQVDQRVRLWDRVNELQRDIQALQSDVGELRAGVQHIGRTTDAIFAVVAGGNASRRGDGAGEGDAR
jgi:hypothetical protein